MTQEEDAFYYAIENPQDFRRELLGSSKYIIQLLQRYEKIKRIREEKVALIYEFGTVTKEITMLINRLKKTVPKTKLRNMPKEKEKTVHRGKRTVVHSDVGKLQAQLAAIESKLSKL